MLAMKTDAKCSITNTNPNPEIEGTAKVTSYEQCREERIKENLQRMETLGILNLSLKQKSETRSTKRPYRNSDSSRKSTRDTPLSTHQPSRRSSRLDKSTPVSYIDSVDVNEGKASKRRNWVIGEGTRPEIYTEEHGKLLGNTEQSWTFFVDGYAKDGKRIYDPINGKTCHQCRQKTLGHRTECSECNMVQGQFCGDCLYMRYGEHVLEALENPNWKCPVCRGICNCSLCRNHKGWIPTGPIYRKISKLGYKSVAHYLIQTRREQSDDPTSNQSSAKRSLSFQEKKSSPEENPLPMIAYDLENQEDTNSAKRSLSFLLPSDDDQTSLVDVQVLGYLKRSENVLADVTEIECKEEHSCTKIGDDLQGIQDKTSENSSWDDANKNSQALVVDFQVLSKGTEKQGSYGGTRSKRRVDMKPNPDSIGGRLKRRRRSQSGLCL